MHLRFLSGISLAILAICVAAGCAAISEAGRGIAGISTKTLQENRVNAVKKLFPLDYAACKGMVEKMLADINAYIYARDEEKR